MELSARKKRAPRSRVFSTNVFSVTITKVEVMKSRIGSILLFLCVVAIGGYTLHHFWKSGAVEEPEQTASPQGGGPTGTLQLPAEKIAAAGIRTVPITKRAMKQTRTVPGHIQYDDTRHVAVKAATAGALIDVKVKPGDAVSAGQVLAVLSSPEVGTARATVLQHSSDLKLKLTELEWATHTNDALKLLVDAIQKRESIDSIRTTLKGKSVGKSRETLLSAYSRFQLADSLLKSLASAGSRDALTGRQVGERQNEYESADASLQAVSEQVRFDAKQDFTRAKNAAELAQNTLKISEQHLVTLLGYKEAEMIDKAGVDAGNLSLVEVKAPFAGTIEQKFYSNSERVQLGDTLFALADTTQMWVAADLREGEWSAMSLHAGDAVVVTTPAMSGREFDASVYYIGREVSSATNSVPLMATINNSDGLLRPGLFVRVLLPLGESREVLTVPDSAICEHESRFFVFVTDGERTYRRVFVTPGTREGTSVEIVSGLTGTEAVVDRGAFVLKSEMLLERE